MTDDFKVLIDSLGTTSFEALGSKVADCIRITSNETLSAVHVVVVLHEDSWSNRLHATDLLQPVREMFMDELALDFAFEAAGDKGAAEAFVRGETREFACA